MSETPKVESVKRVYEGRLLKVDLERIRNPAGNALDLEIIRHPGASAVLPVLEETGKSPQVLLLKQFRHAAGQTMWEIPAGVLEPGESARQCAIRELKEEAGATAGKVEQLTSIFTTPGFTDEVIHLFLATELSMGTTDHQHDEFIEVVPTRFDVALDMVREGTITDGKTIATLLFAHSFIMRP